jgi:hypothetical protein
LQSLARVERLDAAPHVLGLLHLADARSRHVRARLQDPRRLDAPHELAHLLIVEQVYELRHAYPCVARLRPHRELVAEGPRRRCFHPRQVKVLADEGGRDHVELFEGEDAVEPVGSRELCDDVRDEFGARVVGQRQDVVERLAGPVLVRGLLARDEDDARALPLALAQELFALEIAGDADDVRGSGRGVGHFRLASR